MLRHRSFCLTAVSLTLVILTSSGCQQEQTPLAETTVTPTSETAATPTTSPTSTTAPQKELFLVKSLQTGDRACYIELENAKGETSNEFASFELCEQENLVGKRVRLTRKSAPIMAMSCQGRPDCTESETVNLIVKAEVIE
jgi:hypothetical protein